MSFYAKMLASMSLKYYLCRKYSYLTLTIMKKITSLMAMLLMAMATLTFTSCDDDEEISNTLWGVWKGNMGVYYDYGDYEYDASYSVIAFDKDPSYYASGTGYWIDYYTTGRYDYYASHIQWTVRNGIISIYSEEDGDTWYISDYRLTYDTFSGILDNGYSEPMSFSLYKTSAPNWNDYYWDGWYSSGYYGYSNTKQQSRSAVEAEAKPVRHIRGNCNE